MENESAVRLFSFFFEMRWESGMEVGDVSFSFGW